jgi:sugar transferase (PEP-CTERM system associated)
MIRLFNHYLSVRLLLLTGVEAAVLYGSVLLGFHLRFPQGLPGPLGMEAVVFTFVTLMAMSALGLYSTRGESLVTTLHRLLVAFVVSMVLISAVFYLIPDTYIGRGVMAVSSVVGLLSVLVIRVVFFRVTEIGLPTRRVLVLGNGPEADEVIRWLNAPSRRQGIRYVGLYPVTPEREEPDRQRIVNHQALRRTISEMDVSEIVIAVRERRGGVLPLRELLDCKLHGAKVMDLQSFYEREQGVLRLDTMRASWLIFGNGFDRGITRDVIKRLFDIVVSMALLVLTAPLLLVAIIAVVVESGFPIFYIQERVGHGGKCFNMLKLRTMRQDAEADGKPQWAGMNDSRVTRVGRFLRRSRVDELPQLVNVLLGVMSFVGPRPERPPFVAQLIESVPFYDVRHSMKPGITGWAQVRYPYGASLEDGLAKLQYDLYYVKNHSLFLDLLVLIETAHVVLFGRGAR